MSPRILPYLFFTIILSFCFQANSGAQTIPYIESLEDNLNRCGLPTCTSSYIENSATTDEPSATLINAVKGWMGKLPDSKLLRDISIPGTHDSGATVGGVSVETQNWTIKEQLEGGIRLLDIRLVLSSDKKFFRIFHGNSDQHLTFNSVMYQVTTFLDENPTEGVLMRVKKEHDSDDITEFVKLWNSNMAGYASYLTGKITDPKLGDIRKKIYVMRNFLLHGNTGSGPNYIGMTFYDSILDSQNEYRVYTSQLLKGVSIAKKEELVLEYINKADTSSKWIINWLSGAFGMAPEAVAWHTNDEAFHHLDTKSNKTNVGTLIMDFPGEGLIYRIIKTNFNFYKRRKYYLQIDCYQPGVANTGTDDYTTVKFYDGNTLLGTVSKIPDCGSTSDAKYSISAEVLADDEEITHVTVETSGSDAFYMDELFLKVPDGGLFDADTELTHWGRESGSGWVLSTDIGEKINGVSARECSIFYVDGRDSPGGCDASEPLLDYYFQIDCNHEAYDNDLTGTVDVITVSFYKGDKFLKSVRKVPDCDWNNDEGGYRVTGIPKPSHVIISTEGGDAFYMDEIRIKQDVSGADPTLTHWGRDNGSGFILSTQSNDIDYFDDEDDDKSLISSCFKFYIGNETGYPCDITALCKPKIEVNLDEKGVARIGPADLDNGSSSEYGNLELSINISEFDCSDLGNNTVTMTAKGVFGVVKTCQTTVKVMDVTAPNAQCQDVTVGLDGFGLAILDPYRVDLGSVDDCAFQFVSIGLSQNTFTCFNMGDNEIEMYAMDSYGNRDTCQAVVTVEDKYVPIAQCIPDTTVYLDPSTGTAVLHAADLDAGTLVGCSDLDLYLSKSVFFCSDLGSNKLTLTAKNANGQSSCNTNVTIKRHPGLLKGCTDTIFVDVGTMDVPGDVDGALIEMGYEPQTPEEGMIYISIDGNKIPVDVSCFLPACAQDEELEFTLIGESGRRGIPNCLKVRDFLVRAKDLTLGGPGWHQNDQFAIRVRYSDDMPPLFMAEDIVSTADPGLCGAKVDYQVEFSDGGHYELEFNYEPGTIFPIGTTRVTATATDICGNDWSETFDVTIEDTAPPQILAKDIQATTDPGTCGAMVSYQIETLAGQPYYYEFSHGPGTIFPLGTTTVEVIAADGCERTTRTSFEVSVKDIEAPRIECLPVDIPVYLDASGLATLSPASLVEITADACGIASVTLDKSTLDCSDVGPQTLTVTATDNNGLSASCMARITVHDKVPPEALCNDFTIQLDESGWAFITKEDVDAGSNDACGILTTGQNLNEFDCSDVGDNFVHFMVIDKNYNVANCRSIVTVEDNIPPQMILKPNIALYPPDKKFLKLSIGDMVESVWDNCGDIDLTDVVITGVSSDEPQKKANKPDILLAGDCRSVSLRKDREGGGNGRVYRVHLEVTDVHDNTAGGVYTIYIKAKGGSTSAVDDGLAYTAQCNSEMVLPVLREESGQEAIAESLAEIQSLEVYPNPFKEQANIRFNLPVSGEVSMAIFNLYGQQVHQKDLGMLPAGKQQLQWDGYADGGAPLPSGVYFIYLMTKDSKAYKKISLMK